jgi:hypothetical protein
MPTFRIFLAEIEEELQPTSIMQKILFPQIANLVWRLRRLPEAQADIFQREHERSGNANPLSASQLLAQRFSQDPSNGFALLGRYERSMQQMLLRLLREYYNLKKHYPYTPYHPSELHGRPQPGWNEHQLRATQRKLDETMDRAAAAREEHLRRERAEETAEEAAERTQSNPPQNTPNDSKTDNSALDAPHAMTKRSHHDDEYDDLRRGLLTSVGSPSPNSDVDRADNSV